MKKQRLKIQKNWVLGYHRFWCVQLRRLHWMSSWFIWILLNNSWPSVCNELDLPASNGRCITISTRKKSISKHKKLINMEGLKRPTPVDWKIKKLIWKWIRLSHSTGNQFNWISWIPTSYIITTIDTYCYHLGLLSGRRLLNDYRVRSNVCIILTWSYFIIPPFQI